jgi:hypothetical protein
LTGEPIFLDCRDQLQALESCLPRTVQECTQLDAFDCVQCCNSEFAPPPDFHDECVCAECGREGGPCAGLCPGDLSLSQYLPECTECRREVDCSAAAWCEADPDACATLVGCLDGCSETPQEAEP